MFEFVEEIFYDWTITGFLVWIVLSVGSIYVSWFVKIPSAVGSSAGFPITVKIGISVVIPIVTWYMINNKEWTANTFGKIGKRNR